MGQVVAGTVGAVIGFYVGGPQGAQIGWALGSALYASQQVVKGPALNDAKVQASNDGMPIAIIYGTSDAMGNVIEALPIQKRWVRSQGSKGGPKQREERAYQTFAIMFSEPVDSVTRIWENEKLVYDITPDSVILDESAEYAEKFRFYDGSETQLPDPTLEEYHGVGLTPAYRGTAYIVWPGYDITPFGQAIPQMRVELVKSIDPTPGSWGAVGLDTSTRYFAATAEPSDWDVTPVQYSPVVADEIVRMVHTGTNNLVGWNVSAGQNVWTSDDFGATWVTNTAAIPAGMNTDRTSSAYWNGVYLIPGDTSLTAGGVLKSDDDGATWTRYDGGRRVRCVAVANGIFMSFSSISSQAVRTSGDGETWQAAGTLPGSGGSQNNARWAAGQEDGTCVAVGKRPVGDGCISRSGDSGDTWDDITNPFSTPSSMIVIVATNGEGRWVIANQAGQIAISATNGFAFTQVAQTFPVQPTDIVGTGDTFIMCGTGSAVIWYSTDYGLTWASAANVPFTSVKALALRPPQAAPEGNRVTISSIIEDQCLRKGLPAERFDVTAITDTTRGFKVAGGYNPADVIRTLGQIYFFDAPEYDGKIYFLPRGRANVLTIDTDDLVTEVELEESVQSEHAIEYPRVLRVVYTPSETGYQSTTQTSERYSPTTPVLGEIVLEAPINFETDEAAQQCEIAHKVAWVDANGEIRFTLPEDYAQLVPSDCVVINVNGKTARIRLTQIERVDGELRCRARFDRISAYTSTRTGQVPIGPTPPPSTIRGLTGIVWCNLPTREIGSLVSPDPAFVVGMTMNAAGWLGATLEVSTDGGETWITIADETVPSVVGTCAALPSGSSYAIDRTNSLVVTFPDVLPDFVIDEVMTAASMTQIQNRANLLVIQNEDSSEPELIQFEDAVETSPHVWTLTGLHRGGQNTAARAHTAGETVMILSTATLIRRGDIGPDQEIQLRAVSYDTSPEDATIITREFAPVVSLTEFAPSPVPEQSVGANTFGLMGAEIFGTFSTAEYVEDYLQPGRHSTFVFVSCVVNGRAIVRGFHNSLPLQSASALVTYSDGVLTMQRTVAVREYFGTYGVPSVTQFSYLIQDLLTDAEQTAFFGSVPGSLDVTVQLINSDYGPGTALEYTV